MKEPALILSSIGLPFERKEDFSLRDVKPLPSELYVRKSLDREWVENLKDLILQGFYEPVLIVASYVEALGKNYLVDTHHTYEACRELGRTSAPALVISKPIDLLTLYELQLQLNKAEQKPVSLREKKESLLRLYIKLKNMHGDKFWENRRALLEKLSSATEIPIRTIYAYLEEQLKEEKKQLQEIALRLYKQGVSQEKIEEMLGVPQQTLSYWLRENNYQIGITDLCRSAQSGGSQIIIFLNKQAKTLNPAFLGLMSSALEEGARSYEFFREKAERFEKEELEEFRRYLNTLLEEMALSVEKLSSESLRKSAFVKLVREKLSLSEKAGTTLYEESKGLFEVVKKAREELLKLVEELCEHDEAVSEERLKELVKQRLEEKRRSGRFGEGSEYALLAGFIIKHFLKLYAELEERAQECLKKRPVLTEEEVFSHYTEEELMELKEEELREELRACFPQYKIPQSVVKEVANRVSLARENKIKNLLLERAKDPKTKDLQEIAKTQEEREILRKHFAQVQDAFNSLKIANEKTAFDLNPESEEDLERKLQERGYRTYNAQELFEKVKRVRELLKEFEEGYCVGVGEYEEKLSPEDRTLVWKFNNLFLGILNQKKKGGEQDHIRWAKIMQEENLSLEEVRKRAWEEERLLLTPAGLTEAGRTLKREEDEENKKKGIGTRGMLKTMEELLLLISELRQEIEKGDKKNSLKLLAKMEKKIRDTEEKLRVVEGRKGLQHPASYLAPLVERINDFSRRNFNMPMYVLEEEKDKLIKLSDRAVSVYEELAQLEIEKDFVKILRAFLETYSYAFLRWKVSGEKFFINFKSYRHDWINEVRTRGGFFTLHKEFKSREEIARMVEQYIGELER